MYGIWSIRLIQYNSHRGNTWFCIIYLFNFCMYLFCFFPLIQFIFYLIYYFISTISSIMYVVYYYYHSLIEILKFWSSTDANYFDSRLGSSQTILIITSVVLPLRFFTSVSRGWCFEINRPARIFLRGWKYFHEIIACILFVIIPNFNVPVHASFSISVILYSQH